MWQQMQYPLRERIAGLTAGDDRQVQPQLRDKSGYKGSDTSQAFLNKAGGGTSGRGCGWITDPT